MKPLGLLLAVAAAAALLGGCDEEEQPPLTGDILEQLQSLPDVQVSEYTPDWPLDGYRYFHLSFYQPINHEDPFAGGFWQYVALQHRDLDAPLVVYTSGYEAGWVSYPTEPTMLLDGNQISIEYRFYGDSRPETGAIDWSKLNVHQAAADEHAILAAMKRIYHGAVIATGGSKGGEHALQHARLYPDDVDGVVAYVAPVITDLPDLRYQGILDDIGTADCRARLRAVQRATLERRAFMEARAAESDRYDIAGVAHATETAIVELEWSFWKTRGESHCSEVPDADTDDWNLWAFLQEVAPPADYADDTLLVSGQQYIYQDMTELGYPVWMHAHLDDLMQFSYEDWSAYLPAGEPIRYAAAAPRDLADWLATDADHIMLVSGEWDPWAAATPSVNPDRDTASFWVPHGSHWSTDIYSLPAADQSAAIATLDRWAGHTSKRAHRPLSPPAAPMATLGPEARRH